MLPKSRKLCTARTLRFVARQAKPRSSSLRWHSVVWRHIQYSVQITWSTLHLSGTSARNITGLSHAWFWNAQSETFTVANFFMTLHIQFPTIKMLGGGHKMVIFSAHLETPLMFRSHREFKGQTSSQGLVCSYLMNYRLCWNWQGLSYFKSHSDPICKTLKTYS